MKSTLLWAGVGAIIGHFIEIYILITLRPKLIDHSTNLNGAVEISPAIFALPIYGALVGILAYQLLRPLMKH